MNHSVSRGVRTTILPALTTTGTGSAYGFPNDCSNNRFEVKGVGTISAGTLIIEESFDPAYTGLWSQLASVDLTTLSTGAVKDIHVLGSISNVRARLSVDVSGAGGSISVEAVGA